MHSLLMLQLLLGIRNLNVRIVQVHTNNFIPLSYFRGGRGARGGGGGHVVMYCIICTIHMNYVNRKYGILGEEHIFHM